MALNTNLNWAGKPSSLTRYAQLEGTTIQKLLQHTALQQWHPQIHTTNVLTNTCCECVLALSCTNLSSQWHSTGNCRPQGLKLSIPACEVIQRRPLIVRRILIEVACVSHIAHLWSDGRNQCVVDEAFPVETIKPPRSSHSYKFPWKYSMETENIRKRDYISWKKHKLEWQRTDIFTDFSSKYCPLYATNSQSVSLQYSFVSFNQVTGITSKLHNLIINIIMNRFIHILTHMSHCAINKNILQLCKFK